MVIFFYIESVEMIEYFEPVVVLVRVVYVAINKVDFLGEIENPRNFVSGSQHAVIIFDYSECGEVVDQFCPADRDRIVEQSSYNLYWIGIPV